MLSTSAVIIESNSRVRSESIEPISCKTSPVLRLLLNCEFFGGMIGLDPVLFWAGRWLSEGPQVDIPVFLEKFVVGASTGFQSGIFEWGDLGGCCGRQP